MSTSASQTAFRCLERGTGGKHGEPGKSLPLRLREEVDAPVDRLPKRLLPSRQIAWAAPQQRQVLRETNPQHGQRQRPDARRGQLDRKWKPVDTSTDRTDIGFVRVAPVERRIQTSSPLHEELDRLCFIEGRHREDMLARNVQNRTTRDQQGHTRSACKQIDEDRSGFENMLGVVDDEQELLRGDGGDECLERL